MMYIDLLQLGSRDFSDDRDREIVGRRELGRFGKGRIKDNMIARRASKGESKINSNEGADLKGLSVTQQIMSAHRKT